MEQRHETEHGLINDFTFQASSIATPRASREEPGRMPKDLYKPKDPGKMPKDDEWDLVEQRRIPRHVPERRP